MNACVKAKKAWILIFVLDAQCYRHDDFNNIINRAQDVGRSQELIARLKVDLYVTRQRRCPLSHELVYSH